MTNKNRFGYVAVALVAALLATVVTVPLKYAAAQNASSSQTEEKMTEGMIKAKIVQLKAEHPVFVAVLERADKNLE
jgi:ABC-type phosphate/phosphonate transport system permease subunit